MSYNNINAGKTGTTIPVQARLYYLKEGEKEVDETLQCILKRRINQYMNESVSLLEVV